MRDDKQVEKLGRKVINAFTRRITDEIFLFMEGSPELLREYKAVVKRYSSHSVNAALGKMICVAYGLENLTVETKPDSPLLKKYTRHYVNWNRTRKKRKRVARDISGQMGLFAEKRPKRKVSRPARRRMPAEPARENSLFEGVEPKKQNEKS
jgi:hypothetical protein